MSEKDKTHQQQFYSKDFYIHPLWNKKNQVNDIGLIRLPEKIKNSSDHISNKRYF